MKYLLTEPERKKTGSTAYLEFQHGISEDFSPWKEDSLNMEVSTWHDAGFDKLLNEIIPSFDYYGINLIDQRTWVNLLKASNQCSSMLQDIIKELTPWVEENFKTEPAFTIIGL